MIIPKRIIVLLLIVVVALISSTVLYRVGTGATIVIDASAIDDFSSVYAELNSKPLLAKNEQDKTIIAKGIRGKVAITVKYPGMYDYSENKTVLWKNTIIIIPTLIPKPASEIATTLDSGFDTARFGIQDVKYFDNNTWMAYRLLDKSNPTGSPTTIIAYYENSIGEWVVLNYGTENEVELTEDGPDIPIELYREYVDADI